jgi:hypothetical protein
MPNKKPSNSAESGPTHNKTLWMPRSYWIPWFTCAQASILFTMSFSPAGSSRQSAQHCQQRSIYWTLAGHLPVARFRLLPWFLIKAHCKGFVVGLGLPELAPSRPSPATRNPPARAGRAAPSACHPGPPRTGPPGTVGGGSIGGPAGGGVATSSRTGA